MIDKEKALEIFSSKQVCDYCRKEGEIARGALLPVYNWNTETHKMEVEEVEVALKCLDCFSKCRWVTK